MCKKIKVISNFYNMIIDYYKMYLVENNDDEF